MDKNRQHERIPYRDKLSKDARDRYLEKLSSINNIDPYDLTGKSWSADPMLLPPTSYLDITNYLIHGISAYTYEQFRNYKSLEAHGHFTNGWVQDLLTFRPKHCDNVIVSTKVSGSHHSFLQGYNLIDQGTERREQAGY